MKLTDAMSGMAHERGQSPKPMGGEHDGGEHGSIHEHLKAIHAAHGGKHMIASHDGVEHTTHHVGEDGEVQGPHNHSNLEELKSHMGRFFDEEEHEGENYGHHDGHEGHGSIFD